MDSTNQGIEIINRIHKDWIEFEKINRSPATMYSFDQMQRKSEIIRRINTARKAWLDSKRKV